MFDPILPVTPAQWLTWVAPVATLVLGLAFFLAPASILSRMGLTGADGHHEATGEARSNFAGFLIGLAISAMLFDQPGLYQTVGMAWAVAVAGKLAHVIFDGGRSISVLLRLVIALGLAAVALSQAGLPQIEFDMPATTPDWLMSGVAALTALIGFVALVVPRVAMAVLRLAPREGAEAAPGELRGTFAGFHIAVGMAAILFGGVFIPLALGAAWLIAAFGRMISMLSDGGNNPRNWLLLLIQIMFGAIPVAAVFGLVA